MSDFEGLPSEDEVVLYLTPGWPGDEELLLRVSPRHADELRECLEAEGLHVSGVLELSAGSTLEILAAAVGSGGLLTAGVTAFLNRHKGKKVTFGPDGTGSLESLEGYSAKDVKRILDAAELKHRERQEKWAAIDRKADSDDDGQQKA